MSALGATVKVEKDVVKVTGAGREGIEESVGARWTREIRGRRCGCSTGILAGQSFTTKLSGDASIQKRPMGRVVSPLRQMGADIRAREDNFAPLEIHGTKLHGIHYKMPMASAQVKSAVLLAGLFAEGVTSVTEPVLTRDHTELALEEFGVPVEKDGTTITVRGARCATGGGPKLQARSIDVPGDISSAVFFIAAASMFAESNIMIHGVGLNPTRTAILDVFAQMGASLQVMSNCRARTEKWWAIWR